MALRAQVIDLVWANCLEHPAQSCSVGQVAVVQGQLRAATCGSW